MSKKRQVRKSIKIRNSILAADLPGRILFHCPNCRRSALATLKKAGILAIPTTHSENGSAELALAVEDWEKTRTALEEGGHQIYL